MTTMHLPVSTPTSVAALPEPRTAGFAHLLLVEGRKLVDTRAGRWLLAIAVLVSVGATALGVAFFPPGDVGDLFLLAFFPLGLIVPVVAILAATAEWSQRTGLTTFALEPRRGRVVAAKLIVSQVTGLAITVVSTGLTYAAAGIGALTGQSWDGWGLNTGMLGGATLTLILVMFQASASGLILLHTPAAVVLFFVVPQLWTTAVTFVPWLNERASWIDLNTATEPLMSSLDLSAHQWAQVSSATALWVLLPLTIGTWRFLRAEVK